MAQIYKHRELGLRTWEASVIGKGLVVFSKVSLQVSCSEYEVFFSPKEQCSKWVRGCSANPLSLFNQ